MISIEKYPPENSHIPLPLKSIFFFPKVEFIIYSFLDGINYIASTIGLKPASEFHSHPLAHHRLCC